MVWLVRHRRTKEPETDSPYLNHRATSRLYFKTHFAFCNGVGLPTALLDGHREAGVPTQSVGGEPMASFFVPASCPLPTAHCLLPPGPPPHP
jgi:hypothetical protein